MFAFASIFCPKKNFSLYKQPPRSVQFPSILIRRNIHFRHQTFTTILSWLPILWCSFKSSRMTTWITWYFFCVCHMHIWWNGIAACWSQDPFCQLNFFLYLQPEKKASRLYHGSFYSNYYQIFFSLSSFSSVFLIFNYRIISMNLSGDKKKLQTEKTNVTGKFYFFFFDSVLLCIYYLWVWLPCQ